KTVVLHTDSLKYAYLELDLMLQWIDGYVERCVHRRLEGPVRVEILNPFTKNGESMVLDGHMSYGLYTDDGERYLTSVGAEPDNYVVLAEGSDFLELNFGGLCGSGSRLPEMPSDGFEGWDLKYMADDVYLLTLERFYLWSSVTRKVSSVALPIRGCIDGPKNRIHAIVSDYRNDFNADIFVVVDDMVLRFNVEPRDEKLQLCNLYSPGVGRITAWTATTCKKFIDPHFHVAGAKGMVSFTMQPQPRKIRSLPALKKSALAQFYATSRPDHFVRLHNGNLVPYREGSVAPDLATGPYVRFLDGYPGLDRYVLLTADNHVKYVEIDMGDLNDPDPTITQYVLPNPALTSPLYVEGVHYNPVCFWGSSELTHQTIPITSYMITNLVTCKMSVCIDGRSFMKRGEPSHLGELENGFLEDDPLLKLVPKHLTVVKAGVLIKAMAVRVLVVTNHYLLMEKVDCRYQRLSIDTLVKFNKQRTISGPRIPLPSDKERNRQIVDFTVSDGDEEFMVLLECAYVVYFKWDLVKKESRAIPTRWRSIPGMKVAKSFQHSMLGTTQVFGFAERTGSNGKKILTPAIYDLDENFQNMVACEQDMSAIAALPNDHYQVRQSKVFRSYFLDLKGQKAKDDVRIIIPSTRMNHLRPLLVNHKIQKIVAYPMETYGITLIAVIGPALTLMVYQPEFERLTTVNEHYPRYPCVDVTFARVSVEINKDRQHGDCHIKGYMILATENDIEVLEFYYGGSATNHFGDPNRPKKGDAPEVVIAARSMFNVGPRVCSVYCPTTNEAWEENRLSVFYTAQKLGSETETFIGKMTIDVSKKGSPLGYDHLRVPCNGNFEPDQKFQLLFKRDAKTNEPTLEIYHSIPTNRTRFKFTTWDLQKKSLEFDKTVEAFETIENHKKVHSLKWQVRYYTVKTRMVDSKVIRPTEPEIEPYYYLHERNGELGWVLPKKSNGNPVI
ncbi:unnamed protein product, partial [Mesorhabditis spiculigera]